MTARTRAGLRIPYELNTALILTAKTMGISKNALILQILMGMGEPAGKAHKKPPAESGLRSRR